MLAPAANGCPCADPTRVSMLSSLTDSNWDLFVVCRSANINFETKYTALTELTDYSRLPVSLIITFCVPWFVRGRLSFDSVVLGGSPPSASTTTTGWSFGSASSVGLSSLSEIVIFGFVLPVIQRFG